MGVLTRDQILGADDLPKEEVPVPEWGGSVFVRTMPGKERDAWESQLLKGDPRDRQLNMDNVRARLASLTIVDAEGNRLFDLKDIEALGQKSAAALDRIWEVAQRLNRMSNEDVEELAGE